MSKYKYHTKHKVIRLGRKKGRKLLTICIGTICDNGKKAIVITDRMVTSSGLSVEFEHETKIQKLAEKCLIVTAGDASIHEEILRPVEEKYKNIDSPKISDIVDDIKQEWCNLRIRIIEENFFRPRNLTMNEYYERQADFIEYFISSAEDYIVNEELIDLELLLIGIDIYGAHLYYITDPGTSRPYTSLGFCSIGSGEPHAENSLIANHFSRTWTLEEAMYLTYEAKKQAEIAPGVGEYTNIAYVDEKECHFVSDETIKKLHHIYEKKDEQIIEPSKKLMSQMIKEIKIVDSK